MEVVSNIERDFIKIIDSCFPKGSKLGKVFNRQTVKISYSGTPNMEKIISAQNAKFLVEEEIVKTKECNCPKYNTCPMGEKCLNSNLIYNAAVATSNEVKNYIGLCSATFKARLAVYTQSFKNSNTNQTSLSKHIAKLKNENLEDKINWKIVDRGKPYTPVNDICQLCTKEAYYIIFNPEMTDLNSKNEIFNSYRHKKSAILYNSV